MSVTSNFYTPVEIKKGEKGRMEINEEDIESEMRDLFGITDDPEPTPDTTPEESPKSEVEPKPESQPEENTSSENTENAAPAPKAETPATETAPKENSTKDTPLNPEEKFNKQNSAFAQMRIENKGLSNLIMELAKATGQNPKNITEAQDILRGGLSKVVSKNRNIPEDVLREMEEDKKKLAEYQANQTKQEVLAGFQKVQTTFGLSREDVYAFADELIKLNLNPYEQKLDLVKEYKSINFDRLIAKAREEGVQEERARSIKAQTSSTTPSTQKGITENTGTQEPIKTVKDLDNFLENGLKNN